ncbi:MAG: F0F1 ATP synthase subunit epsilon [Phycisphaerales bacterium]
MADRFHCSLVTPEKKLIDEEVTYASIPGWDGQIGIAPKRAALLVKLGVGSLRLDFPEGGTRWYLIEGGFAQMLGDRLTILANRAMPAEAAIESDAQKELDSALEVVATTDEEARDKDEAVQAAREKRRLARLVGQRGI